jgi:hypothetical protein
MLSGLRQEDMRYVTSLILCAAAVFAQALPQAKPPKKDVGTSVEQPVVDYYDSMSDYFRQSRRAIDLIARKGIPDQEIPAVLTIARRSKASPNQVIAARQSGQSFADIAKTNGVTLPGQDFVTEANITFLAEYHGRTPEEIRALHAKGANFIEINQQYRRVGVKPASERPAAR